MLALVAAGALLVGPPALPEESSPPPAIEGPVEAPPPPAEPAPASEATPPVDEEAGFVIAPGPVEPEPAPVEPAAELPVVVVGPPVLVAPPAPSGPIWVPQHSRKPPWSGSGRFVGGAFMLVIGTGLLVAATFEFADGRDTTKPMISNLPAGIGSIVAGGVMIGTGIRDQHRLSEWEAVEGRVAPPSGNGLIVAGVATTALGGMAAIATSIASDMDLDAPRSIPAGWATAAAGLGGGVVMIIAGSVRRAKYGRAIAMPTIAPTRAGASIGISGRF